MPTGGLRGLLSPWKKTGGEAYRCPQGEIDVTELIGKSDGHHRSVLGTEWISVVGMSVNCVVSYLEFQLLY